MGVKVVRGGWCDALSSDAKVSGEARGLWRPLKAALWTCLATLNGGGVLRALQCVCFTEVVACEIVTFRVAAFSPLRIGVDSAGRRVAFADLRLHFLSIVCDPLKRIGGGLGGVGG